jgi:tellurite resistance protein TehA-like permease
MWTVYKASNTSCSVSNTINVTSGVISTTVSASKYTVCSLSDVVTLTGYLPQGATGLWSGNAFFPNVNSSVVSVSSIPVGSNTLTWTVTSSLGCGTSAALNIINREVTVAVAGADQSLCNVSSMNMAANAPGASETGVWSVLSGYGLIANSTLFTTQVTNLARGSNRFKWTVSNGNCSSDSYVTIKNNKQAAGFQRIWFQIPVHQAQL